MTSTMTSMKNFKIWYLGGIVLSIVLTVFAHVNQNNELSPLILVFGVGHVLILAIMGFRIQKSKDRAAAGLRVQTSGYLHTLIGFSAALFQLDPENLLATIVVPLSYALFTSIVGWCLGGELVNEFHEQSGDPITNESEKLAQEFRNFADSLTVIHRRYAQEISNASESFQDHLQRVAVAYERMLDTYELQLNRLNKKHSELSEQLETSQQKFIDTQSRYYQKHSELSEQLETSQQRFIDNQNRYYLQMENAIEAQLSRLIAKHSELYNQLDNQLETSQQRFVDSQNRCYVQMEGAINYFTSILSGEKISYFASSFASLNEQTNFASQSMEKVAISSKNVSRYLDNSKVLIEELENLLNLISSYRRTS
ncbi:hypothetical protein [Cylindrospermopsis raciborskii]|uniref:hypothetical protein n=2 Tax=Cylindrospermopsis raciborskii TaxID=77022 RepID=UPI0011C04F1F|nr:hypothetical protein [Cylindrospermopsis raciborskii]UJL33428.1 hypothetical protein C6N34_015410 [Cylindrospermopsis raciborskii Cr2010]